MVCHVIVNFPNSKEEFEEWYDKNISEEEYKIYKKNWSELIYFMQNKYSNPK